MLFYWYLLCSRKANFYVIHRQYAFCLYVRHYTSAVEKTMLSETIISPVEKREITGLVP